MRVAWGLVLLVLTASAPVAGTHGADTCAVAPPIRPSATPPYEVPAWHIGDWWKYNTHVVTASPDGTSTDTLVQANDTVAAVETATVLGRTYTAYNSTVSGVANSSGVISVGGNPYQYSVSGSVDGWILNDRSDLALVAENQTATMQGTMWYLFITFPLWLNVTTTARHGPAEEDLDFPLELGDAWSYQGIVNTTGFAEYFVGGPGIRGTQPLAGEGNTSVRSWFNATESKTVPAGTFPDAARIHSVTGGGTADRWYDPDVRNYVAAEIHDVSAPDNYTHVWLSLTGYGRAPVAWPGTIALNPPRVDPGGPVVANGTANPNEDLVVRIPSIAASYPTTADGTGAWSLALVAPTIDDSTPANSDIGSHGVLVEPASGAPVAAVATLQLFWPDLYALDADLLVSNPSPSIGETITVWGTVHERDIVGESRAFTVTFAWDGVPFANATVPGLPAGGNAPLTANVSGSSAGWHILTFTADSGGDVAEANEANNTATLPILVRGPDLSLANITIDSGVIVPYPDPAAVGYVSAPVDGRLGGFVNVTFEAASVGTAAVNASFVVAVVETQGLFGPPLGARLLQATVAPPLDPGARAGPWTASWPVPTAPGVYHLNVTVDADAQIPETWEANNNFAVVVNVSGPDYRVASVGPPAGQKVTVDSGHLINVTVRNDGALAADRAATLAGFEGGSGTPFATATIPALAVGGQTVIVIPWTAPVAAGIVNLTFVADPDGALAEMDETNNETSVTVDVRDVPATTVSWSGPNVTMPSLFVRSTTVFSFSAADRSDTDLTTWYRIDAGPVARYTAPFSLTGEGAHGVAYWSADGLGGVEPPHLQSAVVDDTPPATTFEAASAVGDRRTVTLNASDGPGVGVGAILYRVDNASSWRTYAGPFEVSGYGDHTVAFRAVDRLNNTEPDRVVSLSISLVSGRAANLKPFLAVAFAILLLIVGLGWGRADKGWHLRSPRTLAVLFALVELGTGALSITVEALAVPLPDGSQGIGLPVDLAILGGGLLAASLARRQPQRGEPPGTPK